MPSNLSDVNITDWRHRIRAELKEAGMKVDENGSWSNIGRVIELESAESRGDVDIQAADAAEREIKALEAARQAGGHNETPAESRAWVARAVERREASDAPVELPSSNVSNPIIL